jgi:hypothetical protein
MRKYLMSMLVLGIAVAAAAIGTYAWYTKSVQTDENTVATDPFGCHIALWDPSANYIDYFDVQGLQPGGDWVTGGYLGIWNAGPQSVKYRFYIPAEWVTDSYPEGGVGCCEGYATKADCLAAKACGALQTKIDLRVTENAADDSSGWLAGYERFTDTGDVWYSPFETYIGIGKAYEVLGPMPVNFADIYRIQVKMESDAGNSFQGTDLKFKITADCVQSIAPCWAETCP